MRTDRKVFASISEYGRESASVIEETARESLEDHGRFTIALCGGKSVIPVLEELCRAGFRIPWSDMLIFWSDERCVAHEDINSNYRLANEKLLSKIPVLPENAVPVVTGGMDPVDEALVYEEAVKSRFPEDEVPVLDLILLGVGPDGHTASLFPGSGALDEKDRLVVSVTAPCGFKVPDRITFTLPLINSARKVMFLVRSEGKEAVLNELAGPGSTRYPAGMVAPREHIYWMICHGGK